MQLPKIGTALTWNSFKSSYICHVPLLLKHLIFFRLEATCNDQPMVAKH